MDVHVRISLGASTFRKICMHVEKKYILRCVFYDIVQPIHIFLWIIRIWQVFTHTAFSAMHVNAWEDTTCIVNFCSGSIL